MPLGFFMIPYRGILRCRKEAICGVNGPLGTGIIFHSARVNEMLSKKLARGLIFALCLLSPFSMVPAFKALGMIQIRDQGTTTQPCYGYASCTTTTSTPHTTERTTTTTTTTTTTINFLIYLIVLVLLLLSVGLALLVFAFSRKKSANL